MANHYHRLKKIYIETKIKGEKVEWDTSLRDLISKAESEKNLYKFNEDTFFACYKTTYKSKPCVLIVFSIFLVGPVAGSSMASKKIMAIVEMMEKMFSPIKDYHFTKEVGSKKQRIGLLRIIKEINENDMF